MTRLLPILLLALFPLPGFAAEILYLDGRREVADRVVVKEDAILVSMERGLRRVGRPEVVQVVLDDGTVVPIERDLAKRPLLPVEEAALAALADAEGPALVELEKTLLAAPSRSLVEALREQAESRDADERTRAGVLLVVIGTRETVETAIRLALDDRKRSVRRAIGSALFRIRGLLMTGRFADLLRPGLEHSDRNLRACFAMALGITGDETAIPVIRKDALGNPDHHVREMAAEVLASLGDDSGLDLLLRMLERTSHPASADGPGGAELIARLAREEKIRVCRLLGELGSEEALPALRRASEGRDEEVAAAARRALEQIEESGE